MPMPRPFPALAAQLLLLAPLYSAGLGELGPARSFKLRELLDEGFLWCFLVFKMFPICWQLFVNKEIYVYIYIHIILIIILIIIIIIITITLIIVIIINIIIIIIFITIITIIIIIVIIILLYIFQNWFQIQVWRVGHGSQNGFGI